MKVETNSSSDRLRKFKVRFHSLSALYINNLTMIHHNFRSHTVVVIPPLKSGSTSSCPARSRRASISAIASRQAQACTDHGSPVWLLLLIRRKFLTSWNERGSVKCPHLAFAVVEPVIPGQDAVTITGCTSPSSRISSKNFWVLFIYVKRPQWYMF